MDKDTYDRLLDEYKEICAYHRSEDQLRWQVLGITYGAAALLATTAIDGRFSYSSVAIAALAAAIITFGSMVYLRLHQYTIWRLQRAWSLEKEMGFNHHLHICAEDDKHKKSHGPVVTAVRYATWLPWVLVAAYVVLTYMRRN